MGSRHRTWPDAERVLADPAASRPLKAVLRAWMSRDAVDAANDAEVVAVVLARRLSARGAVAS